MGWIPSGGSASWGNITGTIDDQNDLQDEFDTKLSLTGGTMTGTITVSSTTWAMTRDVDNSGLMLYGGSDQGKGSRIILCGKDMSENPGGFQIDANNGSQEVQFIGKTDGTLSWNGKTILTGDAETVGSTDTPVYMNSGIITSTGKSFSSYLPLAGGTMTGTIQVTPPAARTASIKGSSNSSTIAIWGGSTNYGGARLDLNGGTNSDDKGYFTLMACITATNHASLIGTPSGSLTWNGNDISGNITTTTCAGIKFWKIGRIVHYDAANMSTFEASTRDLGTLTSAFYPISEVAALIWDGWGWGNHVHVYIGTDGIIHKGDAQATTSGQMRGTGSYISAS